MVSCAWALPGLWYAVRYSPLFGIVTAYYYTSERDVFSWFSRLLVFISTLPLALFMDLQLLKETQYEQYKETNEPVEKAKQYIESGVPLLQLYNGVYLFLITKLIYLLAMLPIRIYNLARNRPGCSSDATCIKWMIQGGTFAILAIITATFTAVYLDENYDSTYKASPRHVLTFTALSVAIGFAFDFAAWSGLGLCFTPTWCAGYTTTEAIDLYHVTRPFIVWRGRTDHSPQAEPQADPEQAEAAADVIKSERADNIKSERAAGKQQH